MTTEQVCEGCDGVLGQDAIAYQGAAMCPSCVDDAVRPTRYTIDTEGDIETFELHNGRVVWSCLPPACDRCGCEVHSGRRNAETDSELRARLHGKRTTIVGSTLACANCGREYAVSVETT